MNDRSHISKKSDAQIKVLLKRLGGTPYNLYLLEIISEAELNRYTKRFGN